METNVLQGKNQKLVRMLSWILIVVSALVLLSTVFTLHDLSSMVTMQGITKNFNPPVELNFAPYLIKNAIELLLCVIIFISSTFVLKYKKVWKQILVYSLIASIIFLVISPLMTFYNPTFLKIDSLKNAEKEMMNVAKTSMLIWSYIWSIIFSVFLAYVIWKLSRKEIKVLFN
jgi:hypothetical protein